MTNNFSIGVNRFVSVKKVDGDLIITISELGSDVKTLTFPARRWVQTHKSIVEQASRRIDKPTVGETKRGSETIDRWEILRIGHNRVYVCRFERVLLPPDERSECYEAWNSSTTQRAGHIERCNAEAVCQVPDTSIDYPVYVRTGSSECQPFQFDELFFSTKI